MRWWYHLIAAAAGLAIAAVIVVVVFGSASQQGSLGGSADTKQAATVQLAKGCGSIAPVDVFDAASVRRATQSLPSITANGRRVRPARADEAMWFGRLHAASGRCIRSITMSSDVARINVSYGQAASAADIGSYAYAMLSQAFSGSFGRPKARIEITSQTNRRIVVSARAWQTFQQSRASFGFDPSIEGLAQSRSQFGFGATDLRIVGF